MFRIVKTGFLVGWILLIIYLSYSSFTEGHSLEAYIYWSVLIGWVYFVWQWRKNSYFSLYFSFILFIIAALVVTVGLKSIGEVIMRLSFTFLLVGFVQSLFEYKRKISNPN